MVQVLHLSNGDTLNQKLADPSGTISQLIDAGLSNEQIIERLFVVALARPASDAEMKQLLTVMAEYGDERRQALEDAFWSVLASTEFTFNH